MSGRGPVHLFCGASRGQKTLDQGEGGGNPFASGLVELLAREELSLGTLAQDLVHLTKQKSRGYQQAEVPDPESLGTLLVKPGPAGASRRALIVVMADYAASGELASLQGARHDAWRVAAALHSAGFHTTTLIDPTQDAVAAALEALATASESSDVSVIYTTGHGVEADGVIFLLPGDFRPRGQVAPPQRAMRPLEWAQQMRGQKANLLFYAGCRDDPFKWGGPPAGSAGGGPSLPWTWAHGRR